MNQQLDDSSISYRIDAGRCAVRAVGEESVVLDLGSSVYFALNRSAGVLWSGLVAGSTIDQLVEALMGVHPAPANRSQAEADVQAFLHLADAESLLLTAGSRG